MPDDVTFWNCTVSVKPTGCPIPIVKVVGVLPSNTPALPTVTPVPSAIVRGLSNPPLGSCVTLILTSFLPSDKSAISIPTPSFIIILLGVNLFWVVTTLLNSSGIK